MLEIWWGGGGRKWGPAALKRGRLNCPDKVKDQENIQRRDGDYREFEERRVLEAHREGLGYQVG